MVGDSARPSRPRAASVASFFIELRSVVVGLASEGYKWELWWTIVANIWDRWGEKELALETRDLSSKARVGGAQTCANSRFELCGVALFYFLSRPFIQTPHR